jgi:hypothetical protein
MKFLSKSNESNIFQQGLVYRRNAAKTNHQLKQLLVVEQNGYCAYTEKYLQPLDAVEVEHLDTAKKYADDYYNYYAVIRKANLYKKDEKYRGASFLESLFFHNAVAVSERIGFKENVFYEVDENDVEARAFIDFLNLNHPALSGQRATHLALLQSTFNDGRYDKEAIVRYFKKHPEQLSFLTALEAGLGIPLFELLIKIND